MNTKTITANNRPSPSFNELMTFLATKLGGLPAHDVETQQFEMIFNGPEGTVLIHGDFGCLGRYVMLVCAFHHIAHVESGHRAVGRLLRAYNRQSVMGQSYLDPDGEVWLRRSVFLSTDDWRDQVSFVFESSAPLIEDIQSMLARQGGPDREVRFFD